jgi:glycosyltransferase involved in cell wall biosynthesis
MTLVSVVVPTRNRPRFLASTLKAILAQRDVQLEVIVVDDASDPWVSVREPSVRVVRHERARGTSAARNSGIAVATGDWLAFCDDDDVWAPDKLSAQLAATALVGASWVYAGDISVDQDLRIVGGGPPLSPQQAMLDLHRYNAVPGSASSVMVATNLLSRVGGFDTSLVLAADWDMWLRLARWGPPAAVHRPLVAIRQHRGNASRDIGVMLREIQLMGRRHRIAVDVAAHLRWAAWMRLEDGRPAAAAVCYLRAAARGDVRSIARALVALAAPRIVERRRRVDRAWAECARRWLSACGAAI